MHYPFQEADEVRRNRVRTRELSCGKLNLDLRAFRSFCFRKRYHSRSLARIATSQPLLERSAPHNRPSIGSPQHNSSHHGLSSAPIGRTTCWLTLSGNVSRSGKLRGETRETNEPKSTLIRWAVLLLFFAALRFRIPSFGAAFLSR